jgi:hypothetical protein
MVRRLIVAVAVAVMVPIAWAQEVDTSAKRLPGQVPPRMESSRKDEQLKQKREDLAEGAQRDRSEYTVNRYLNFYARMFRLDDAQRIDLKKKLEVLAEEQNAFLEGFEGQFEAIREKIAKAQADAKSSEIPAELQEELRVTLENMRAQMPLNDERVEAELAKMLPATQMDEGRQRLAEHRKQQQERQAHKQVRQDIDQRGPMYTVRGEERARPQVGQTASVTPGPAAPATPTPVPPIDKPAAPEAQPLEEKVLSPWERYGEQFIAHYRMDPAQQETVRRIVKELIDRRADYEAKHAADYEALDQLTEPQRRAEEQAALDKPINEMFEELKQRLTEIPTTAQLESYGDFS